MEQPLGVEWNTRVGFQKATLPKVVKKVRIMVHSYEGCQLIVFCVDGHCYRSIAEEILVIST